MGRERTSVSNNKNLEGVMRVDRARMQLADDISAVVEHAYNGNVSALARDAGVSVSRVHAYKIGGAHPRIDEVEALRRVIQAADCPRRDDPWTLVEEAELLRSFYKGSDCAAIAAERNRTQAAILTRLVRLNALVWSSPFGAYYKVEQSPWHPILRPVAAEAT
jgi:hypothetical protein